MQGSAKSIGKKLESFFSSVNLLDWQAMMQSASCLTAPHPFSHKLNLPGNKARTMFNLQVDKIEKWYKVKIGHKSTPRLMLKTKFKQ